MQHVDEISLHPNTKTVASSFALYSPLIDTLMLSHCRQHFIHLLNIYSVEIINEGYEKIGSSSASGSKEKMRTQIENSHVSRALVYYILFDGQRVVTRYSDKDMCIYSRLLIARINVERNKRCRFFQTGGNLC